MVSFHIEEAFFRSPKKTPSTGSTLEMDFYKLPAFDAFYLKDIGLSSTYTFNCKGNFTGNVMPYLPQANDRKKTAVCHGYFQ